MFDIGFSEILVIGVVALIVIGPERLPKVARTLGHMFGRLQRYVNEVKADINREMELDELRKLQSQVQSAARDIEQSVSQATREMESGVRSVESQLNEAAAGGAASAAPSPPQSNVSTAAAGAAPPPNDVPASPETASVPEQASLPGFERI
ncbi:MAG: Sec-independent protein translocase subunit TatB [Betaproteobacteria bacterium]|nr:MAG: Sec-independent protein translocase subunit TatB [Betaproteobacteria bacterium]